MIDNVIALLAPHHCCGCDKIGSLLCGNCKYNITIESKIVCVVCKRPTKAMWLCNSCRMPYERVWVVGERTGILQRLIGLYKFERAKEAYKQLAGLLLEILPELPPETVIVPVPTTSGRVRERGYDHMLLIAKRVARARGLQCVKLIKRQTNTKQRQASAKTRITQAKQAFMVQGELDPATPYLLVDDVITTGATIKYASKTLRDAGAKNVWVAVIARQTLE